MGASCGLRRALCQDSVSLELAGVLIEQLQTTQHAINACVVVYSLTHVLLIPHAHIHTSSPNARAQLFRGGVGIVSRL